MTIRSFLNMQSSRLVLGAACAGMFLTTLPALPGLAQQASLSPQKGWAVQKLKDSKGADYCALSRPYSNSSVLTLARNNKDEYSLAVDLQNGGLESEKPYSVTLQPGPGQLRAYEVMPSSPDAFVVRLGGDENFLDALTGSEMLKVQIGEERFEYQVSDFPSGLNDLESCMTSGGAKPVQKAAPAKEAKKEDQPAAETTAKAEPSKAVNILSADPVSASKNFSAKKMTAAPAMPAPDVEKSAKAKVAEDKAGKVTAIMPDVAPQAATAGVANTIEITQMADGAREPIHAEELLQAEAKDSAIKTSKQRMPVPETKPDVSAQTNMTPEPPVAAPTTTRMATIDARAAMELKQKEQEVASLRARNDQLRGDLAKAMSETDVRSSKSISDAQARIIDLEGKLEAARTDNQNLLSENERYKRLSEDTMLGEAKGDWDLEQATKRFNEAEREIQRLALELDREKSSCQRKTAEIEHMLFDPAVADKEQRERLASLEQEIEALRSQQGISKEDVERRIAEAVKAQDAKAAQEQEALRSQVASLQQSLAQAQNEPKQDPQLMADKKALEDTVKNLQAQLAEAKSAPKVDPSVVSDKAKLAGQVATLSSELAKAKIAMQEAQAQAAGSKEIVTQNDPALVAEKNALEQQVASLSGEVKTLQASLQQAQTNLAKKDIPDPAIALEKSALEKQVASLSGEVKTLQASLQQAQTSLDQARKAQELAEREGALNAQQASNLEGMQENVQNMQERMAEMAKQRDQANDQVVVLRNELEKMRLQFAEQQGMEATKADQSASLKLENERLRTQLSMKDKESTTYRNQVAGLQQDVAQLKSRVTVAETQPKANTDEVLALRNEISALRSQMSRMQSENNKVVASLKQDRQNLSQALNREQRSMQKRVAAAPVERQPLREIEPATIEPAAAPEMQARPQGFTQDVLQAMLSSAGLSASPINRNGANSYSWRAGQLQGKAVVNPSMPLERGINEYIAQERGRCQGDFASMPSSEGRGRSSYEIACVSPAASMSSSVLFFEKDGSFVAIAHDTDTADMDVAMDARDRILGRLPSIQSAAW